ncbi:Alkaline phosphatase [Halovivax asiaticus JCM 14624]|uniref:Alkaline phosphatase n=1 Tax=Halovivax asiaticus JCM 14624 TaxID=1227490 RepID=M0BGD7_9EURY|nr:alkaline phosphatase D family protein [Halovivax asiaticus]ELZ09368.1 Alkaline phosphatase [Halovivax asiaticus JCM 14624]
MPDRNNAAQHAATSNRRGFLERVSATGIAGGIAVILGERSIAQRVTAQPAANLDPFEFDPATDPDGTFPQSVASGGPTSTGVILWTRIDPAAYEQSQPLAFEVAADEAFENVVSDGIVAADSISPEHDYTVNLDLDGELESNERYYYRFLYDGVASRTGRCRTLPGTGANLESLSLAVLTCQDYQNGYYGAYAHLAEEDVDFLVHMGDFIYESADGQYTSPTTDVYDGRDIELPSGKPLAETLEDFRHLYTVYRGDPLLQRGLEQHTLIAGWDDHEIGNNWWWDEQQDAPRLPEKDRGDDPTFTIDVAANGIQAWIEYMPSRVEYDPDATELHEQLQLWRSIEFGDLATLVRTDERLYRDGPPCGERRVTCDNEDAPDRTMLGEEQREWFLETVTTDDARWTVWANEVLTMPITAGKGYWQTEFIHDSWDGFQAERETLMTTIADADVRNFVTLSGDLHCSIAGYQRTTYNEWWWVDSDPVGVELMTPSITSVNAADVVDFPGDLDDDAVADLVRSNNPHMEFVDWHSHGYAVVEFTQDDCTYTVYEVDKTVNSDAATKQRNAAYRIPDGKIDLEELEVRDGANYVAAEPEAETVSGNGTRETDVEAENESEGVPTIPTGEGWRDEP